MKKIGLGTRPSEIKGRDKEIDLDDTHIGEHFGKVRTPKKPVRRSGRTGSGKFLKISFLAILSLGIGLLAISFLLNGFSLDLTLDHAQIITEGREISVKDGQALSIKFSAGLKIKRVVFKGFYRLFPPDDITIEVVGIPESAGLYDQDILPALKPEEQTAYDLLISKGNKQLGKIPLTLDMDAQGWIARADAVEDRKIKTACFKKAAASNPDSEEAHIALGRLYEGDRKITPAIAAYESAVRINSGNVLALKSLVSLYKKKRYKSKLITTYERLAAADAEGAGEYYFQAGMIAEKKNDPAKAMSFYRKVLAVNRVNIDARQRLIKIYEKDKQWNRVAGNTKVLLENDPKNPDLYLYLSDVYLKMNNIKAALSHAEKAEKLKSGSSSIYLQLALLYEKAKKDDKAIEYYKKAVKRDRKNAAAFNNLGLLLERNGKRREAVTYYEKAVGLKPKDTGYYTNLADAYEKNKEWKKAIAVYKQVVDLDKKNKAVWEALSVLYYKTKNRWKTLEAYQALSGLEPRKVLWHQKMAALYEELGKLDKARKQYKTILDLDPKNRAAKQKYVEISKKQVKGKIK